MLDYCMFFQEPLLPDVHLEGIGDGGLSRYGLFIPDAWRLDSPNAKMYASYCAVRASSKKLPLFPHLEGVGDIDPSSSGLFTNKLFHDCQGTRAVRAQHSSPSSIRGR